jgi:GTP-binding protein
MINDGLAELTGEDRIIAKFLKRSGKKIILAINKIDNARQRKNISPDIYKLGLGPPVIISAINGIGTGDLLDIIVKNIPQRKVQTPERVIRISIIGKTNVGKSSLLNAMIGEEKMIVTSIPHTTREPHDTHFSFKGTDFVIVDTAGLRKKRKLSDTLEKISAINTAKAIAKSDVCLFVTDVSQPLSSQDQHIADLALRHQNGILIIANKWDLVANKDPQTFTKFIDYYQRYFPAFYWAPIVFTSAWEKQRTTKLLQLSIHIHQNRQRRLEQAQLNTFIDSMQRVKSVGRLEKKKPLGPYDLRQVGISPPSFVLIAPRREDIHHAFINVIEKAMRKKFDFTGTPINITLQRKK